MLYAGENILRFSSRFLTDIACKTLMQTHIICVHVCESACIAIWIHLCFFKGQRGKAEGTTENECVFTSKYVYVVKIIHERSLNRCSKKIIYAK